MGALLTGRLTSRSSGRVGRPRSGFAGSALCRAAQLQIRWPTGTMPVRSEAT